MHFGHGAPARLAFFHQEYVIQTTSEQIANQKLARRITFILFRFINLLHMPASSEAAIFLFENLLFLLLYLNPSFFFFKIENVDFFF